MSKHINLLMDLPSDLRYEFLRKVMRDVMPSYKITHDGDLEKQLELKRTLPNIYSATCQVNKEGCDGIC